MPALAVSALPADVSDVRAEPDTATLHTAALHAAAHPATDVDRPAVGAAPERRRHADAATHGAGSDPDLDRAWSHRVDRVRVVRVLHPEHAQWRAHHACHLRATS